MFCDIQNRLRTDHFRLCEIFNPQYFNTAPISPPFRGRGFLTVGEALFLRDARTWLGDNRETERVSSTQGTVQTLKLAAVAVAFDQLDYAIEICRHFENTSLVSLDTLARESNVKYISMLRDLCRAADSTHSNHHSYLEPPEKVLSSDRRSHARVMLSVVLELVRLTLLALASKFSRKILRRGFGRKYPPTNKILFDYGFEELAIKQVIRNAGIPYLTGGYYTRYLDLIMLFLFRTLQDEVVAVFLDLYRSESDKACVIHAQGNELRLTVNRACIERRKKESRDSAESRIFSNTFLPFT